MCSISYLVLISFGARCHCVKCPLIFISLVNYNYGLNRLNGYLGLLVHTAQVDNNTARNRSLKTAEASKGTAFLILLICNQY